MFTTRTRSRAALLAGLTLAVLGLHAHAAEVVDSVQFGKLHNGEPGSKSDSMVAHQFRGIKASYGVYKNSVAVTTAGALQWQMTAKQGGPHMLKVRAGVGVGRAAYVSYLSKGQWVELPPIESTQRFEGRTCVYDIIIPVGQKQTAFRYTSASNDIAYLYSAQLLRAEALTGSKKLENEQIRRSAEAARVSSGDGLSLSLSRGGRIRKMVIGGEDCTNGSAMHRSGLTVTDVDSGRALTVEGQMAHGDDGQITYAADLPQERLKVALTYRGAAEYVHIQGEIESAKDCDRGVIVSYALPIDAMGWHWCGILERDEPIVKGRHYEEGELFRSATSLRDSAQLKSVARKRWYRLSNTFCSTLYTPERGISLAQPRDEFRIFRTHYDADAGLFQMAYALGLSPDTRRPNKATFSFIIYSSAGEWGYRAALEKYYRIYPRFFENRIEKQGGTSPFTNPLVLKNSDEFMHRFAWSPQGGTVLRKMGLYTFSYYAPTGIGCNIKGYGPESGREPTLAQKLEAIDRVYRGRKGYTPNAAPLAIPMDREGKLMIHRARYSQWNAPVSLEPDLAYGKFLLSMLLGRMQRRPADVATSGIAYDGLTPGLNYRRDHFRYADHPLLYDSGTKSCTIYNFFSCLEFVRELRKEFAKIDRYTIVNITPPRLLFAGPLLDVFTEECGIDPPYHTLAMHRMSAFQKPVTIIAKELWQRRSREDLEGMMRKCLYWGVFPGCFDGMPSIGHAWANYWVHPEWYNRDRATWRKHMPLIQDVATAGWHPVPYARADRGNIGIQRFGRFTDGVVYFTLRNMDPLSASFTLRVDRATLDMGADTLAIDELADSPVDLSVGHGEIAAPVVLAGKEIGLMSFGRRSAYQARRLNRAIRWLETRKLYRDQAKPYGDRLTAWNSKRAWKTTDYFVDRQMSRTGRQSIRMESPKGGVLQPRMLLEKKPCQSLVLSGWSRSERVGSPCKDYAIKLHINYMGESRPQVVTHGLTFPAGTNDWQRKELKVDVSKPIKSLAVSTSFESSGQVWFDDLALRSGADGFQENLLRDPGFEERFLSEDGSAELDSKMNDLKQALVALRAKFEAKLKIDADQLALAKTVRQKTSQIREWIGARGGQALAGRELRDLDDIERLLKGAGFFGGDVAVRIRADRYVYPGQELRAEVNVSNTTGGRVSVASLRLTASDPRVKIVGPSRADVALSAGQQKAFAYTVAIPISIKEGDEIGLAVEVKGTSTNGDRLARTAAVKLKAQPIEIDITQPQQDGESYVLSVKMANNLSDAMAGRAKLVFPKEAQALPSGIQPIQLPAGGESDILFRIPLTNMKRGRHDVQVEVALKAAGKYSRKANVSFGNLALARHGGKITVDSFASQYRASPLNDGVVDMRGLNWKDAAWASRYTETHHWVEIQLPRPARVSRVLIFWAYDHGSFFPSRQYCVQYLSDGEWRTVLTVQDNDAVASDHSFTEVTAQRIRIWQPAGGGNSLKPRLMWVGEVEVY